jgi:predicted NAD/FAD-dependent oxidoreductase
MSAIAPEYAPAGRGLFVANTAFLPRDADSCADLAEDMRRTLAQILGRAATDGWELVAVQRIPHAIPRQWPSDLAARLPSALGPRVFVAGDHLEDASINGAMRSGRLAAERAIATLSSAT